MEVLLKAMTTKVRGGQRQLQLYMGSLVTMSSLMLLYICHMSYVDIKRTLTTKGIGMASNGASSDDSGDEDRAMLEEYWSSNEFRPIKIMSLKGEFNVLPHITPFPRVI